LYSGMMLSMKTLLLGVALIVLVGVGGLVYRNAVEYSQQPIACPVEKLVCPDGTELTHTGLSCDFPTCPPPNVTLADVGITFAVPEGFAEGTSQEAGVVAEYRKPGPTELEPMTITIRRYAIEASSTPLAVIQATAIGGTSGLPVSPARFSALSLGGRTFTVVPIDRFEAVIVNAYYLAHKGEVLRFDAVDRGVMEWMEPNLDVMTLPAQVALRGMLTTLQAK